jgi:hypothetical protein
VLVGPPGRTRSASRDHSRGVSTAAKIVLIVLTTGPPDDVLGCASHAGERRNTDMPNSKSVVAHVFSALSHVPICAADLPACSLAIPCFLLLAFFHSLRLLARRQSSIRCTYDGSESRSLKLVEADDQLGRGPPAVAPYL